MQNEKQNLISLSLAGSVGFYLYSKLAAVGMASSFSGGREPASERTKRELLITIEPEVVEPIVEDVVEDIFEEESPPVEETTVDDILAAAEEEVEDVVILEETEAIPVAEEVVEEVEETEVPTLEVEEPVIETPVVEEEVIEEEPGLDIEIPNIEPDDSDVDVSLFDTEEEMPIDNLFGAISENDAEVDAIPSIVEEPDMAPVVEEPIATPIAEEPIIETPALFDETPVIIAEENIAPPTLDFDNPTFEEASAISVNDINDLDDLSIAPPVVETPPVNEEPAIAAPIVEETPAIVEELPITPALFEEPVIEEPVTAAPVIEDIASVSTPAEPTTPTEPAPQVMDNIETLHPVDKKDEGAKAEYKSIMDFFSSL